jgi:predicted NBD/HSP70 family sugar kinase
MSEQTLAPPPLAAHGARTLPSVEVDSYNVEIKDDEGFLGDRVTKGSFREIIDNWRKTLRKTGNDPFGKEGSSGSLTKKELDDLLAKGDPEKAGIIHGAIEEFSQEFALVIRRFLKLKEWRNTQRIVIGGGLRASRVGELVIGRTAVILKADDVDIDLVPIRHDPDEAGLLGAAHMVPAWVLKGHDAILAVDIGGTNIRAGIVDLKLKRAADLSKASVLAFELWRHGEDKPSREDAVEKLIAMLEKMIARAAKEDLRLTPFIGIGCPGIIDADGSIERGAQNLPGNWESSKFNLPGRLCEAIPRIDDQRTAVLMHNDAVVQGLSEVPFMQDVDRWGALTIGTGLGNVRFTNRHEDE